MDDNRDGLLVRKVVLEEHGFHVHSANNGEEGLELFERIEFDVIVTDYRMPRMTGLELIRRIREKKPNARVVLLSGLVEPLGLTQENTGADAVVAKNVHEPARLVQSVRRLINRSPARKPAASQRRQSMRARA